MLDIKKRARNLQFFVEEKCTAPTHYPQYLPKAEPKLLDGIIVTHQQSSSRSGARLPASSCVARTPAQRCVSGLLAHWPGGGGRWRHAGSRTRSPERSPSPSQSPSVYAAPRKARQRINVTKEQRTSASLRLKIVF